MELAVSRRGPEGNASMAARKKFRGYKSEAKKLTREAGSKDWEKNYQAMLLVVEKLQYTENDVAGFSLALEEFQHEHKFFEKAGLFLSALINSGKGSDYEIHTKHLAVLFDHLGHKNEKNITVDGDVGRELGIEMKAGRITVNGDAGEEVGREMKGGSVTVNGNVGKGVGYFMEGGNITVNGDAGDFLGFEMKDGSITVNGNVGENVGFLMIGGRIYHKGKLKAKK
jgi:hypothetical protein